MNKKDKFGWLMSAAALATLAGLPFGQQANAAVKKSTYSVKGGYVYYYNKKGKLIKNKTVKIKGKKVKFDRKGHATSFRGKTQINGSWYYFTKSGKMVRSKTVKGSKYVYHYSKSGKLLSALSTLKGKTYYIDAKSAKPRTNFTYKSGSKWYYFDKTGLGKTTYKVSFKKANGLVNTNKTFFENNQAYSLTSASIENVNGYLTADTWYRPKKILKNGKTWTKSTASDKRPLLMVYWPSRQVFVDYLNFMKKKGLVTASSDFKTTDKTSDLFNAANQIQVNVEKKISSQKSTVWLKTLMTEFKGTESIWTKDSEYENYSGMQLQGGFFTYEKNSKLTPWANSSYRLMGRYAADIKGDSEPLTEYLLANDIDNSNPIVQAEQLNWMYYLLNFGQITGGDKDADAHFDSVRVDALDFTDADLLNIMGQYFKAAYGMNTDAKANAHLNILEGWNAKIPKAVDAMGNPGLNMDDQMRQAINGALNDNPDSRSQEDRLTQLKRLLNGSIVDRESSSSKIIPNYSFIRAHDSNSQDQLRKAIQDATGQPYGVFNQAEEEKGIERYLKDQNSTDKTYNLYNMPAAYAYLLTNKDTIPRVYYGDMYADGGQYMAKKTRYYEAITNLLKSRVKYVSGGQKMNVDDNGVFTSVRYGKGANNADSTGTSETRTEGIGVIISNNPSLSLKDNEKVVLHMGAAHKNQEYRAVILPSEKAANNGAVDNSYLQSFTSDTDAPTAKTDANGDLTFTNQDIKKDGKVQAGTAIKGYSNPDMKGYVAVWVPVGAKSDQDARTQASTAEKKTSSAYESNAAFDSNVIFEGFSNFVYYPTKADEAANVQIAKNASFFKSLGITSFEMAPQYVSSKDKTFLDSTIDNGYAFDDRYDVALSGDNKYGSATDLKNALKALHKEGLQVMADWVPNQIYNLPGKEAVTVSRTDDFGKSIGPDNLKNFVYITNSIGGGEYQKKYGGAFLSEIQKKYPELFKIKQVSTGKAMDPSVKITEWSAKYMNGTNILGRGAGYVLRNANGEYYNVGYSKKDGKTTYKLAQYLPEQLTGTSLKASGKDYVYYDENGKTVKSTLVKDDAGNYYYFDKNGKMVKSSALTNVAVDKKSLTYFFKKDGAAAKSGLVTDGKHTYYFDKKGQMVKGKTVKSGRYTYTLNKSGYLTKEAYK
ncbi:MAG: glycoside hydrolase family 70 protein [Lactobacillus equicursoris]|uniref:glycoside hydrolase family 70 protein n=1 Tax=Lactobacillus equicursoris TaxID=420645 RepID=UPI0024317BFD|nr:glycoside hydrolase family 70 protein [Lactobacillus equicursoris]MDD6408100.1 glycoside hydrolase family 70 protein [Lactobacillus equicursoris]